MRISGEMLRAGWLSDGEELYTNVQHTEYFTSVQILDKNTQILEDQTLYIQNKSEMPDIPDNENAGIFCLTKPETDRKTQLFWSENADTFVGILNRIFRIIHKYEIWQEGLHRCLESEASLQKVVDYLYGTLGNPCYIADIRFRVLAMNKSNPDLFLCSLHWKQISELGYLPYDVVSSIIENPEWKEIRTSRVPVLTSTREFSTPFLTCNLRWKGRLSRQLFLCEIEKKITRADMDMMGIAADLLEKCMQEQSEHTGQNEDYYEYVFRDVFSGKIRDSFFMEKQLAPLKWKVQDMYFLMEIENQEQETYSYEYFASSCSEQLGARPVLYRDRYMAVFHLSSAEEYMELKSQIDCFVEKYQYRGVLSDIYTGFLKLSEAVRWTEALLEKWKGQTENSIQGKLQLCRDFIMEVLVKHPAWAENGIYKGLDIVRSLQAYDRLHHSEYARTLQNYLRNQCNLVKTSKALHIHRNTLVYRLEKLQEMLPERLEDEEYKFLLQMTFEVARAEIIR